MDRVRIEHTKPRIEPISSDERFERQEAMIEDLRIEVQSLREEIERLKQQQASSVGYTPVQIAAVPASTSLVSELALPKDQGSNGNGSASAFVQSGFPPLPDSSVPAELTPLIAFIEPIAQALGQTVDMAQHLNGKLSPEKLHQLRQFHSELTQLPAQAQQLMGQWPAHRAIEESAMRWGQRFYPFKEVLLEKNSIPSDTASFSAQLAQVWQIAKQQFLQLHIAVIDQVGLPFDPSVHVPISTEPGSQGGRVTKFLKIGYQRVCYATENPGIILNKAHVQRGD